MAETDTEQFDKYNRLSEISAAAGDRGKHGTGCTACIKSLVFKMNETEDRKPMNRFLSPLGAWALAFGCSVGWGAFVMPGTTFLPVAGPLGTVTGLCIGGFLMMVLAANYHYMIQHCPDSGGAYSYAVRTFGNDNGFLTGWFLMLTYIVVFWGNATALPMIARNLWGDVFQFGWHYTLLGYDVYFGEVLLSVSAMLIAVLACLKPKVSIWIQIALALVLISGVAVCSVLVFAAPDRDISKLAPAYAPQVSPISGIFSIVSITPWAFVGFETISHSAGEFRFSHRKSFGIMAGALLCAMATYAGLALLSVARLPEGQEEWPAYLNCLGSLTGISALPVFSSVKAVMGNGGLIVLTIAALAAIGTGLIGNVIASSRLLYTMALDNLLPKEIGRLNAKGLPSTAIITILLISLPVPFLGRTAINWLVDVTTICIIIAYTYVSASALRTARREGHHRAIVTGIIGVMISCAFAVIFLLPNLLLIHTLSSESYLLIALWSILGLLWYRYNFKHDSDRRHDYSTLVSIVFLVLIIYTSMIWVLQSAAEVADSASESIDLYYTQEFQNENVIREAAATERSRQFVQNALQSVNRGMRRSSLIEIGFLVVAMLIVFSIYDVLHKRAEQMELEKVRAEEKDRAKSTFLSNMSHEIRTPLNAIIGLDNLALKEPDLPQHTREQLEKIELSAEHLLGIINDILDMNRIESERMTLKSEEFSLEELLEQINVMIGSQCSDKGLEYSFCPEGNINCRCLGDMMKLKQVLINILGNAVKFTNPPGKVSFTVDVKIREDNQSTLRFVVQDTGIGMDREYLPKLFDVFSQENSTTTNRYGGSGLGMAITKKIVELMNGDITVDSEKGVGSVFTVTVPLIVRENALSRTVQANESADTVELREKSQLTENENGTVSLAGKHVLLAEDVEINAEIMIALLEMEGITADHAENGQEAVELFANSSVNTYDAVLMDLRMPVMDGLSATRAIRALERPDAAAVPIIAVSANAFEEDVQNSLKAGMNAHLSKPVEPEKLIDTLGSLIR